MRVILEEEEYHALLELKQQVKAIEEENERLRAHYRAMLKIIQELKGTKHET